MGTGISWSKQSTSSNQIEIRDTKNPQRVAQHCFVASFELMFRDFHIVWSTGAYQMEPPSALIS